MKHTLTLICVQYLYIFKQNKLNKQIKKNSKKFTRPLFSSSVCVSVCLWAVGGCLRLVFAQSGMVNRSCWAQWPSLPSQLRCVFVCVCWPEDPLLTEAFVLHDGWSALYARACSLCWPLLIDNWSLTLHISLLAAPGSVCSKYALQSVLSTQVWRMENSK